MIEKILPSSRTRLKILRIIYENPEINLTELIKKARTSPNIVLSYVNNLVTFNVVMEKRIGGKKKTHIRSFEANLSELGIPIFRLVEIEKRLLFVKKYKEIRPFIEQLKMLLSGNIDFCLIYGSFARFAADKQSDLDVWIVGNPNPEMKKRIAEIFSTMRRDYSIKIESLDNFIKNINDTIHQNISKEHILICNEERFLECQRHSI